MQWIGIVIDELTSLECDSWRHGESYSRKELYCMDDLQGWHEETLEIRSSEIAIGHKKISRAGVAVMMDVSVGMSFCRKIGIGNSHWRLFSAVYWPAGYTRGGGDCVYAGGGTAT